MFWLPSSLIYLDSLTLRNRNKMFEYPDEEVEAAKVAFNAICAKWDKKVRSLSRSSFPSLTPSAVAPKQNTTSPSMTLTPTPFLSPKPHSHQTHHPSFLHDILLMPVTIVPRAVGSVGIMVMEERKGAVLGMGMLNPGRWVSGAGNGYKKGGRDGGF
jgi:recyclin-1